MAILTTAISRSPTTLLNRSLDVVGLVIGTIDIELKCIIYSLDANNDRIETQDCQPYAISNFAENITLVDPANGLYVIPNSDNTGWIYNGGTLNGQVFSGTPAPEYSFLIAMLSQSVNIHNMIIEYITLNDSLGKYNI